MSVASGSIAEGSLITYQTRKPLILLRGLFLKLLQRFVKPEVLKDVTDLNDVDLTTGTAGDLRLLFTSSTFKMTFSCHSKRASGAGLLRCSEMLQDVAKYFMKKLPLLKQTVQVLTNHLVQLILCGHSPTVSRSTFVPIF